MGSPKVLLPWRNGTILAHLIAQWSRLGARQLVVVCAGDNQAVFNELDQQPPGTADRVINPTPDQGMFSSIRAAACWPGWRSEISHWIVALGDQPHLREETLRQLLAFSEQRPEMICQPRRNGRPRHPVVFPQPHFAALATATAASLKQFLGERTEALAGFEADDAGLDLDIDTPADYERARRLS